jgi:hypothetical protein
LEVVLARFPLGRALLDEVVVSERDFNVDLGRV